MSAAPGTSVCRIPNRVSAASRTSVRGLGECGGHFRAPALERGSGPVAALPPLHYPHSRQIPDAGSAAGDDNLSVRYFPVNRATVAGVSAGDGPDGGVVGAINVSPESFYPGSVAVGADRLLRAAEAMARAGAGLLGGGALGRAAHLGAPG